MKRVFKIIATIIGYCMIFMLGYKIFLLTMMVETNRIFKNIIDDNKPIVEDISIHKSNNINEKIYIRKTEPYYIMETNLEKFGYNQKANNSNVYFYNNDENIGLAIDNRQNLYEICRTMTQQSFADDTSNLTLPMMIYPNKLLKKYNINNNADLFNAMVDEIGKDVNILKSNDYIRFSFFMRFIDIMKLPKLSSVNNLYTISGDYDGYIIEYRVTNDSKGSYKAYICSNYDSPDCIEFYFINKEYFTYDKVVELIRRMEIIE